MKHTLTRDPRDTNDSSARDRVSATWSAGVHGLTSLPPIRSTAGAIARTAFSSIGDCRSISMADMLIQTGVSSAFSCQSKLKDAIVADVWANELFG
jgi:hypothetical protein